MGDDKVEAENWEVQPDMVGTEQYIQGLSVRHERFVLCLLNLTDVPCLFLISRTRVGEIYSRRLLKVEMLETVGHAYGGMYPCPGRDVSAFLWLRRCRHESGQYQPELSATHGFCWRHGP